MQDLNRLALIEQITQIQIENGEIDERNIIIDYFYCDVLHHFNIKKLELISMRSQSQHKCAKSQLIGTILYSLLGVVFILSGILQVNFLKYVKVIPLIILLFLLFPRRHTLHIKKVMIGVLLGSIGDIILEYFDDNFFALGAGFFLAGHISYIFAFLDILEGKNCQILLKRKIATVFTIATINLVTVVSDKLKDDDFLMIIILPIYLIFLSFIVIGSLLILLCQKKVNKNQILLFVGTIFFFISDNTLGRCKFTEYHIFGVKQLNGVVIMATYYIGQYLIAMSSQKIQVNIRPVSLISNESDY